MPRWWTTWACEGWICNINPSEMRLLWRIPQSQCELHLQMYTRDLNFIWFPGNHNNNETYMEMRGKKNDTCFFSRDIWGRGTSVKELLSKFGTENVQAAGMPEPRAYLQRHIRHQVSSFANTLIGYHPQWVFRNLYHNSEDAHFNFTTQHCIVFLWGFVSVLAEAGYYRDL